MKKILLFLFIILLGVMVGCNQLIPRQQVFINPAGDIPQAWIDAPLDGMILPLAIYEFVSHGSAEAGIQKVEWLINDTSLGMQKPETQNKLVTFRYKWTPPKAGDYTLRIRAMDGQGVWSEYDEVHFIIGDQNDSEKPIFTDTPTPVFTGTSTPTVTPSVTPTLTPTPTISPTRISNEIIFSHGLSTTQIYQGRCVPNTAEISLQLSKDENIKHVELYVRIVDKESSDSTTWDHFSVMAKHGGGNYSTTLNANKVPGADRFNRATLLYQFIVVGTDGSVIARSHSFNDLNLNNCKIPAPPGIEILPPLHLLPSNTPEVVK